MSKNHKTILVAENDPDIRYVLTLLLNQAGYQVQTIAEGSSIVEKKVDLPDLFILDKDMPLIDGLALCKYLKLKEETKNIPVIMISAYHDLKGRAKEIGVDEFLEKPFDLKHLLNLIDKCIESKRLLSLKQ